MAKGGHAKNGPTATAVNILGERSFGQPFYQSPAHCCNNMCAPTLIDFAIGTSGRTSSWCRRRFYKPNCSFAVQIVAEVSTRPNKQGPQVVESIDAQMRASNVLGAGGRASNRPAPTIRN